MIEFRAVGKSYRSFTGRTVRAVDDFSLQISPGEVLGIAGPNGAGKSTLISLLLGYLRPTDGDVRVFGQEPRRYVQTHGVGYLSELIAIKPRWGANEALHRFATLAGVPHHEAGPRVDTAIARLGLEEHRAKKVKALSKGNLQRLGLAQALLRDERVLILDEPTHGLDPVWTTRFRDIVDQLRRADRVIVIASHNLDELQRLADRVAIIDRGRLQRIVATGTGSASTSAAVYHLLVSTGADAVLDVFPGATDAGRGEFILPPMDLAAVNRGIMALIGRGTVIAGLSPAHSALEQHFREAVGEPS